MNLRNFLAVSTAAAAGAGVGVPAVALAQAADNPLLQPWPKGTFDGVAPFENKKVEHFAPALEAALA